MKNPLKIVIFLLIAAVFVAGAEYLDRTPVGQKFNQTLFLEILCGTTDGVDKSDVTFVGVDQSEKDSFESWPPPRLDWAVILKLLGPGAQKERQAMADEGIDPATKFHDSPVVAIVPALTWNDEEDVLARRAMRERALLLSSLVTGSALGPEGSVGAQPIDPAKFAVISAVEGDISEVPQAGAAVGLPDESLEIASTTAFTHLELSDTIETTTDGVWIPLLARTGEQLLAGFPLQVILAMEKLGPDNVTVKLGGERNVIEIRRENADGEETDSLAFQIPVDAKGRLLVYHGVRVAELYPRLDAAVDLILASSDLDVAQQVRQTITEDIQTLRTNAVVIGFDNEGARQFELAGGGKVSRSELMAMAVATIQSGRYVKLWPPWMRYAGLGGLALLGCLLVPTRAISRASLFIALIIGVGYLALSLVTFQSNLSWTPPLSGIGVCLALAIAGWVLPKAQKKPVVAESKSEPAAAEEKSEAKPAPE